MLPPNSVLFVSDVHLSEQRPQLTELFLQFLRGPALESSTLYVLGDLFDVWVGEDVSFPFHADIHDAFKQLQANHIPIYFISGNRDFLLSSAYLQNMGCQKIPDKTTISLHGISTLIMHGDLMCTQDTRYQWYRKVAQHPLTRLLFLMLPKKTRQNIGRQLREKSRRYQQGKPLEILDVELTSVEKALSQSNSQQLIHGHVHRAGIHHHHIDNHPAKRVVLGDWNDNKGSFVISTPQETLLADFTRQDRVTIKQSYALDAVFPRAVA